VLELDRLQDKCRKKRPTKACANDLLSQSILHPRVCSEFWGDYTPHNPFTSKRANCFLVACCISEDRFLDINAEHCAQTANDFTNRSSRFHQFDIRHLLISR
jgi:hypothetical protein